MHHQPPIPPYSHETPHWHQSRANPMNYNVESTKDYIQQNNYQPNRFNSIERTLKEPRMLHHYTGYNRFSMIDPSNDVSRKHNIPFSELSSPVQYNANPEFYESRFY